MPVQQQTPKIIPHQTLDPQHPPSGLPMMYPTHRSVEQGDYYVVMPSHSAGMQMVPSGWGPLQQSSFSGGYLYGLPGMSAHPMQVPPSTPAQQMMSRMFPMPTMLPQTTHGAGADVRTGKYAPKIKSESKPDIDANPADVTPDVGSDKPPQSSSVPQFNGQYAEHYVKAIAAAAAAAAAANNQQHQHQQQRQQQQQQRNQQFMMEQRRAHPTMAPSQLVMPASMQMNPGYIPRSPIQQTPNNDPKCRIIERNGIKYHVCLTCNKEIIGRGDFNKHYRTHTNEKPYVCRADPNCKKRFGDASTRVRHERVHDMKRYECRHCKFLYTRKDNRDRHENKCTGGVRKRKSGGSGRMAKSIKTWNVETVSFDHVPRTPSASDDGVEDDESKGSGAEVPASSENGPDKAKKGKEGDSKDPMSILLFAASQAPRASNQTKEAVATTAETDQ